MALLSLGRHDGSRVWKAFDWDVMQRLHARGCISDPMGNAKSVALTDHGLEQSDRLLRKLFGAESSDAESGD